VVRRAIVGTGAALLVTAGLLRWLIAPAYSAESGSAAGPVQRSAWQLRLTGPDSESRRAALLRQAAFRHRFTEAGWPDIDTCWFVPDEPSGTTPKFECVFPGGDVLKVKYGRNAELHAEAAATRLVTALGYGADQVTLAPRLRCHGCPRYPFLATRVASALRSLRLPTPGPATGGDGYTDFAWVSIERRLEAPAVETDRQQGWSWWELRQSEAPRAEVDAFRLLAVLLAHWDNKASNQRLVCLDAACGRTLALMQDLGATFGPHKVNLARWHDQPIWADRSRCLVSMSHLPFNGATFPDATISEPGRALLAGALTALSDEDVRQIFRDARFPEFHAATADARDLDAWTAAFRHRVDQIASTRCPGA
jgi:hypothetical protein